MNEQTIAKRYALGLLKAAGSVATVQKIVDELKAVDSMMTENRRLFQWLSDEKNSHAKRYELIDALSAAGSFHPYISNFLKLLIVKGRFHILHHIERIYNDLSDEVLSIRRGELNTADENDASKVAPELEELFSRKFEKKVKLERKVDPELIGGVKINISNIVYDASVKRLLDEIKETICQ